MAGNGNMTSPSAFARQPALAAGGVTAATAAVLAALWGVVRDAGLIGWLSASSENLINAAVLAVVALAAAVWAQRRSTSTAAPSLEVGANVQVKAADGTSLGTVELPAPPAQP